MVLGFTKSFVVFNKRKPTGFEEKIINGTKIHSVRWDDHDRWKSGCKIHFCTGVRTSKYNCFHEGVCKNTQKITIDSGRIIVEGTYLSDEEVKQFAKNDGFDSVDDFWWWFDQYSPFIGKIIHWTDLLY